MGEEKATVIRGSEKFPSVVWCWPYHLILNDDYEIEVTVDEVLSGEQVETVRIPTRDDWLLEMKSLRNGLTRLIEEVERQSG